jgi:hypothetical protein
VVIKHGGGETKLIMDQTKEPGIKYGFISFGEFLLKKDGGATLHISNAGTDGHVIADAVHLLAL